MREDQIRDLIQELMRTTSAGQAYWRKGSVPDQFKLSVGNAGTVLLDMRNGQVVLTVINMEGNQTDRVDAESFYNLSSLYFGVQEWFRKPSKTIDSILAELRSGQAVGNEPD